MRIGDLDQAHRPGTFPTLIAIPGCSGVSSEDQNKEAISPGLRLSLVTFLTEAPGGSFKLESTMGFGTIATVLFPADRILDYPSMTKSMTSRQLPAQ